MGQNGVPGENTHTDNIQTLHIKANWDLNRGPIAGKGQFFTPNHHAVDCSIN